MNVCLCERAPPRRWGGAGRRQTDRHGESILISLTSYILWKQVMDIMGSRPKLFIKNKNTRPLAHRENKSLKWCNWIVCVLTFSPLRFIFYNTIFSKKKRKKKRSGSGLLLGHNPPIEKQWCETVRSGNFMPEHWPEGQQLKSVLLAIFEKHFTPCCKTQRDETSRSPFPSWCLSSLPCLCVHVSLACLPLTQKWGPTFKQPKKAQLGNKVCLSGAKINFCLTLVEKLVRRVII